MAGRSVVGFLDAGSVHSMNESSYEAVVMSTTPTEPTTNSIARARNYAVEEAPPEREAKRPEVTGLDPNALRKRLTPYELIMQSAENEDPESDGAGLEMAFAGGTVEISGEAMAQSAAPLDAAPDEMEPADQDETATDSSSLNDNVYPDLGERVL